MSGRRSGIVGAFLSLRPATLCSMANRLTMSPELSEAVERARKGAREAGELLDPPTEPFRSPLSPEVQAVLREWRDSGEFDRALAEVIADDPELADQ